MAVGVDFRLSYRRLSIAADVAGAGALFVATNRDPIYPAADDQLLAGAGSIVAAVAVASGRQPDVVVGKPEPGLFQAAAEVGGARVQDAVVIGDNLFSDIAGARNVGARSILMLTGVTTPDMVAGLAGGRTADGGGTRRGRPGGGARRRSAGRAEQRLARREGLEFGDQSRAQGFVVMEERDAQRVQVDLPQLGRRQAPERRARARTRRRG